VSKNYHKAMVLHAGSGEKMFMVTQGKYMVFVAEKGNLK